jgi:alkylresorcinol/alkylpyrone synthase
LTQDSQAAAGTCGEGCCSTILSVATAVPDYTITSEDVIHHLGRVFNIDECRLEAMINIVGNAQVRKRQVIFPLEYTVTPRSLSKTNQEYQEHSIRLGQKAAEDCLAKAHLHPRDIDLIITVSCTGFMIPSLDAHLINLMGFREDVRRLPITELGCAAGAMALSKAWEFGRAFPGKNVLIISVELPSLTFQRRDISPANLICSVLFGDGAAAAVVSGHHAPGPHIIGAESYTFPQSLDAMGFDLRDSGFHIVLSKDVPTMIRQKIRQIVGGFLSRQQVSREKIAAYILHPGGQKLLAYIEEELQLRREDTQVSWDVLGEYGNLSSATILFILERCLAGKNMRRGEYGLAAAFGPGFSSELLLLQWA